MNEPNDKLPSMAEPGTRSAGASVGGISSTADAGISDALQRSSERGDEDPNGVASTGNAAMAGASPRTDPGGRAAPNSTPGGQGISRAGDAGSGGSGKRAGNHAGKQADKPAAAGTSTDNNADWDEEAADDPMTPAAADPNEPRREGVLESLGRSISEIVTGPVHDGEVDRSTDRPPKR